MPKLIIICGLPGVGKTTLADELSKELGIFCLHKDSIKESLYETLGMSSLEDSKKLGYPSVKAVMDLAEENLSRGIDVIIEAPFIFEDEGAIFESWREKYGIDIFTIALQLDGKEREKRFLERERHSSHHDTEREREYKKQKSSYSYMPEKKIFLNTDKPISELLEEAVQFVL